LDGENPAGRTTVYEEIMGHTHPGVGELIDGRYRILSRLGEGGGGEVFAAERLGDKSDCAVKILPGRRFSRDAGSAIFREFAMLARLSHPSIVRVFDVGVFPSGVPYLVMARIRGEPVPVPLPTNLFDDFTIRVLEILRYIHSQDHLHGDIKLENLLLCDGKPVLIDFGLSAGDETETSLRGGTPAYLAPELKLGGLPDKQSELFSLGVLLFMLASGRNPPAAEKEREKTLAQSSCSGRYRSAILSLLAERPDKRPPSIGALVKDLTGHFSFPSPLSPAGVILTGREREEKKINEKLQRLEKGRGTWLAITGAEGFGKTRLLDELRVLARLKSIIVFRGEGSGEKAPFSSVTGILERIQRMCSNDIALEAQLGEVGVLIKESMYPGEDSGVDRLVKGARNERLFMVYEAVVRFLTDVSIRFPMAILIDDIHLCDRESREVYFYLGRHIDVSRILLAVSAPDIDSLGADQELLLYATILQLSPLSLTETRKLARRLLETGETSEELGIKLHADSGGAPLLINDLCAMLVDHGAVRIEDDCAVLSKPLSRRREETDSDSGKLTASLMGDERSLFEIVALFDRPVTRSMLETLTGYTAETLNILLETLSRKGLVRIGEELEVGNPHPVYAKTVRTGMNPEQKQKLHNRIAELLCLRKEQVSATVSPEELAYHFSRGFDSTRAVPFLIQAAGRAMKASAFFEALEYYKSALNTAPPVKKSLSHFLLERTAFLQNMLGRQEDAESCLVQLFSKKGVSSRTRSMALKTRADILRERGQQLEAKQILLEACSGNMAPVPHALARMDLGIMMHVTGEREAGEKELLAVERLLKSIELVGNTRLHRGLGHAWLHIGRFDRAERIFETGLKLARAAGDLFATANFYTSLGLCAVQRGEPDKGEGFITLSLQLRVKIGDILGRSVCLLNLGSIYLARNDLDRALKVFLESLELAYASGYQKVRIQLYTNIGTLYHRKGDLDKVLYYMERSIRLSQESKNIAFFTKVVNNKAIFLLKKGEWERSLFLLQRVLALNSRIRSTRQIVLNLCNIGYLFMITGEFKKSEKIFLASMERFGEIPEKVLINNLTNLGELSRRIGRLKKAEKHLLRAEGLARRRKHGSTEMIEILCRLSELYLDMDQSERVMSLLGEAVEYASESDTGESDGDIHRLFGRFYFATGAAHRAENSFEKAVRAAREAANPYSIARALLDYGICLVKRGRMSSAIEKLHEAESLFESMGAPLELARTYETLGILEDA